MLRRPLSNLFLTLSCILALAGAFFSMRVADENAELNALIETALAPGRNFTREDSVLALARAVHARTNREIAKRSLDWYSRVEAASFFNLASGPSLRYGGFGVEGQARLGPCGTMSRVLLNALWQVGIPARKLQLLPGPDGRGGDHTMVEYLDAGAWRVISPSDGPFVWRGRGDAVATLREIRTDPRVFAQIFARYPAWPYRFDRPGWVRWAKLPPSLVSAARAVLGPERFARAETPMLYDRPRLLMLIVSLALSTLLAIAGMLVAPAGGPSPVAESFGWNPEPAEGESALAHEDFPAAEPSIF